MFIVGRQPREAVIRVAVRETDFNFLENITKYLSIFLLWSGIKFFWFQKGKIQIFRAVNMIVLSILTFESEPNGIFLFCVTARWKFSARFHIPEFCILGKKWKCVSVTAVIVLRVLFGQLRRGGLGELSLGFSRGIMGTYSGPPSSNPPDHSYWGV